MYVYPSLKNKYMWVFVDKDGKISSANISPVKRSVNE